MDASDPTRFQLTTEFIKLDTLLKLTQVADSGGQAKWMIQAGLVLVDGERETRRGKKIRAGSLVEVEIEPSAHIRVE